MAKIEKTTKKAVEEVVKAKGLDISLKIGKNDVDAVREPGTVGIMTTKKGNLMVYMVDGNGKLYNTSVYSNKREANGRVLERAMAAARG